MQENRFVVLSMLTSVFQLICVVAIIIGLVAIFGGSSISPDNPFSQVPVEMKAIGGAVLVLYGLTGLVFSGGINVLISIDGGVNELREKLPAALAALQRTAIAPASASQPQPLPPIPAPTIVEPPALAPVPAAGSDPACPSCGTPNGAGGRFCEYCGQSLVTG